MGQVNVEHTGAVAIFRFDNPPYGLLNGEMTVALEDQLQRTLANEDVRAIILTGGGDNIFIRHFDLNGLSQLAETMANPLPSRTVTWQDSIFHRITRLIETCDIPVFAAINGDCMGVGYELALACDIRIARSGPFSIGLPEMNIAMFPGGGGTARLARLIGYARAFELIATATTLRPDDALRYGLVSHVTPDPLAAAMVMATQMASRSASGIAAVKRIIRQSPENSMENMLSMEQREVNARLGSEEVRLALRAYVESGEDLRTLIKVR